MPPYILPLTYLGPLSYFIYRVNYDCEIEIHNHYQRQTYANRCEIATPNGVIDLSIPVEKPQGKMELKDVKLSNHHDWRTLHWRAIESAYNSSPFFEYYRDGLLEIFEKNHTFLFDFNQEMENWVLKELGYDDISTRYTDSYIVNVKYDEFDMRNKIEPKKKGLYLHNKLKVPYYQVFENKQGFQENLSIIDLLFNMGNESRIYLKIDQKQIKTN